MITDDPKVIQREFDRKFKAVASNIDEGLIEIGERGVEYLKKGTPVDSGRLRGSMSYSVNKKVETPLWMGKNESGDELNKHNLKDTVYIGNNVEYAPMVEFGHTGKTGLTTDKQRRWFFWALKNNKLKKADSKKAYIGFMFRAYKRLKSRAPTILKQAMQEGMRKFIDWYLAYPHR